VKAVGLDPTQNQFLEAVVEKYRPHILIGVSGCPNVFNEAVIKKMAQGVERPIVFPLSNPTSQCEADPADVVRWANGKVLIGTGTQFPDVQFGGKTYRIGQCNNYYIFPAMGLAVLAAQAKRVTSGMFLAAADALSNLSPALKHPEAMLFPEPEQVRDVAKKLAIAVGMQAQKEGVAPKTTPEQLQKAIDENFWEPNYWPIQKN
jgi:malate dehydrogenase (oxaloacetate-decarboxylating)